MHPSKDGMSEVNLRYPKRYQITRKRPTVHSNRIRTSQPRETTLSNAYQTVLCCEALALPRGHSHLPSPTDNRANIDLRMMIEREDGRNCYRARHPIATVLRDLGLEAPCGRDRVQLGMVHLYTTISVIHAPDRRAIHRPFDLYRPSRVYLYGQNLSGWLRRTRIKRGGI